MNRFFLFIALCIAICSHSSYSQNDFVDNDTIITWSKNRKLKWEDFKGIPDTLAHKNFSAVTTTEIHFTKDFLITYNLSNINVVPYFLKKKSWSCSSSLETLKHEQIHFDIMELFSRKMRQLFELKKRDEQFDLESYFELYNIIFNECSDYQQIYDSETEHGTIGLKQIEWEEKIAKELKELETYKYDVDIDKIEN